jgi:hypothetical protein
VDEAEFHKVDQHLLQGAEEVAMEIVADPLAPFLVLVIAMAVVVAFAAASVVVVVAVAVQQDWVACADLVADAEVWDRHQVPFSEECGLRVDYGTAYLLC